MPKAVRFDEYGGIDVLEVREVPRPKPGPDQVLVAVRAAGINPSEAKIRSGLVRGDQSAVTWAVSDFSRHSRQGQQPTRFPRWELVRAHKDVKATSRDIRYERKQAHARRLSR